VNYVFTLSLACKRGTKRIEVVGEQGTEENVWTYDGRNKRMLESTA
jgi:hypothetical protein